MSVKTQIKIFDDMFWIYNPGKLPGALKVEDLKKPHSSHPRNRLIANTFYRAGLIEEWGSGIQRMINALKEENLPEPEFEEQGDGFVAKLYGDYLFVIEKIKGIDLNERQQKVVQYAQEGEFKLSDISKLFDDVHERTLRRDLKELVNKQLLKAEGEKKGRIYYLNRS